MTAGPSPQMAPPRRAGSPTDIVQALRAQGLTNNQLVQSLQRDGYKSHEIFDAINQADLKGQMGQMPEGYGAPQQASPAQFSMPFPSGPPQFAPPQAPSAPRFPQPPSSQDYSEGDHKEKIEEVAEAIIEEKWSDLVKNVNKIVAWKEKADEKMVKMEHDFASLKEQFEALHQGILSKISEYDSGLTNIGTEIKALEKVFQKILPTLTENVNELSRITRDAKSAAKQ